MSGKHINTYYYCTFFLNKSTYASTHPCICDVLFGGKMYLSDQHGNWFQFAFFLLSPCPRSLPDARSPTPEIQFKFLFNIYYSYILLVFFREHFWWPLFEIDPDHNYFTSISNNLNIISPFECEKKMQG